MSDNTAPEPSSNGELSTRPAHQPPAQDGGGELVPVGGGNGMPINGVQVKRATESLPTDERDAIRWFHQYSYEHGWNCEVAGSKLRRAGSRTTPYDGNTVYRILRGSYNGGVGNFVTAIKQFREITEKRDLIGRPDFIETGLTKRIFEICNQALDYQRVALVFGDGQIGKSVSFEEFARQRNHGRTRYLRLPLEAPLRLVTEMLSRICACSPAKNSLHTRQNVVNSFDSQTLLIIDELQQVTLSRNSRERLLVLELLREIFDRSSCGMVICGTNEAMDEFRQGPNSLWLRQLKRRALPEIFLEAVPTDEDMLVFAAHFGLGDEVPADTLEEMRRTGREVGIGQYITYLQGAAKMASAEGVDITWKHFSRSLKAMAKLGQAKRRSAVPVVAGNGKEGN